jgi:hypothetical protein
MVLADDSGLEPPCKLSLSSLWRRQREYFRRSGLDAWRTATVPHYVTNNPVTARAQAEIAVGYLLDRRAAEESAPVASSVEAASLHVVELGAGTGRFGFYFLRALLGLISQAGLDVRVRYVLTDFHDVCFAHWQEHPKLQPFLEKGQLDFAVFDIETDDSLPLQLSGEILGPGSVRGSLVVVANYVFDGTPCDAYRIEGGRMFERYVSLRTARGEVGDDGALAGLEVSFSDGPEVREGPSELDAILRGYRDRVVRGTVLLPVSAIRGVSTLAKLSGGDLLLLSGDKGHVDLESNRDRPDPHFVRHGSFSLPVNFHALAEAVRQRGGHALLGEGESERFCMPAFILSASSGKWLATYAAFARNNDSARAHDIFTLRQGIQTGYGTLEIDHLLSTLRLSQDDPRVLTDLVPIFNAYAATLSERQRSELLRLARRTWDNTFSIGEETDVAFSLASLHYSLGSLEEALQLFRESLRAFGRDARTHWNIAACLFALGRFEEATLAFAEAQRDSPQLPPALPLLQK